MGLFSINYFLTFLEILTTGNALFKILSFFSLKMHCKNGSTCCQKHGDLWAKKFDFWSRSFLLLGSLVRKMDFFLKNLPRKGLWNFLGRKKIENCSFCLGLLRRFGENIGWFFFGFFLRVRFFEENYFFMKICFFENFLKILIFFNFPNFFQ